MATDLANQLPTISRNGMRVLLPHTKASFKIQVSEYQMNFLYDSHMVYLISDLKFIKKYLIYFPCSLFEFPHISLRFRMSSQKVI